MKTFEVSACSSMTLQSESGRNYWFRTCDIDTDIWAEGAHVVSIPAESEIDFYGRGKEKSLYSLLGITNNMFDTWIMDGINEKGLTGGLLLLLEGAGVEKRKPGYEGYVGMELVTKFLSVCSNVQEVILLAEKIQVCKIPYEGQSVQATMHYFFMDITGDAVVLEAADEKNPGVFAIYSGKETIGVMTNSPVYPKQIQNLAWYISVSPELKAYSQREACDGLKFEGSKISGDREAAHFLRSNTFPASYCSYDRFVRLAVLKALNDCGRAFEDEKMLARGSGIMSSVFEPRTKGVFHYTGFDRDGNPTGQKDGFSQYLVMYDLTEKTLYLRVFDAVTFTKYELPCCDNAKLVRYEIAHDGMAGIIKGNESSAEK